MAASRERLAVELVDVRRSAARCRLGPGPQGDLSAAERFVRAADPCARAVALIEGVDTEPATPQQAEPVRAHLSHRTLPIDELAIPRGRAVRFWPTGSAAIVLAASGILLIVYGTSPISILEIAGA